MILACAVVSYFWPEEGRQYVEIFAILSDHFSAKQTIAHRTARPNNALQRMGIDKAQTKKQRRAAAKLRR